MFVGKEKFNLFCPSKKYTSQSITKHPGAQIASPGWDGNCVHVSVEGLYSQNSPSLRGEWSSPSPLKI